MAEPFGIAASAIQLARTLHAYVDTVKSAQKQLKAVATEVKLTASVLDHLGAVLKENEAEKLCTANVILDAQDALSGCRDAFGEIEEAFKGAAKAGLSAVSTSARLAWPFRKGKVEALQANLERLKSTLLLMLSVLSYAREKAARPAAGALSLQRIQIQNLIKAKADAMVRYEELLVDMNKLHTGDAARSLPTPGTIEPPPFVVLNTAPVTNTSQNVDQKQLDSFALFNQLGVCASAVSHLASSISATMVHDGSNESLKISRIKEAFGAVNGAVNSLLTHDVNCERPRRSSRMKYMDSVLCAKSNITPYLPKETAEAKHQNTSVAPGTQLPSAPFFDTRPFGACRRGKRRKSGSIVSRLDNQSVDPSAAAVDHEGVGDERGSADRDGSRAREPLPPFGLDTAPRGWHRSKTGPPPSYCGCDRIRDLGRADSVRDGHLEDLRGPRCVSETPPSTRGNNVDAEPAAVDKAAQDWHGRPTAPLQDLQGRPSDKPFEPIPILHVQVTSSKRKKVLSHSLEGDFDATGNKIESTKKQKKLTSAELPKQREDRAARRHAYIRMEDEEDDEHDYQQNLVQPETRHKERLQMASGPQHAAEGTAARSSELAPSLALTTHSSALTGKSMDLAEQPPPFRSRPVSRQPPFICTADLDMNIGIDGAGSFDIEGSGVFDNFDFDSFMNEGSGANMDPGFADVSLHTRSRNVDSVVNMMERYEVDEVDELIKRWTTVEV